MSSTNTSTRNKNIKDPNTGDISVLMQESPNTALKPGPPPEKRGPGKQAGKTPDSRAPDSRASLAGCRGFIQHLILIQRWTLETAVAKPPRGLRRQGRGPCGSFPP